MAWARCCIHCIRFCVHFIHCCIHAHGCTVVTADTVVSARMVEAIEKIRTISSALGKTGGLHVVEPDSAKLREAIGNGFRFLAYSLDIRILDVHSRLGLEECRR
jgi:hypothetical protein